MQNEDGTFRNFLSYSRHYLDEVGSEDAFGRAIWALGYLVQHSPGNSHAEFGEELLWKALPHAEGLSYLRGIANALIGICCYLKVHPSNKEMSDKMHMLTSKLTEAFDKVSGDNWNWFENYLTYDNAILPLALYHSAEISGDKKVLNTAVSATRFLELLTVNDKCLSPVGNNGWYFREGIMPLHDQQAIESMAMVLMYAQAFAVTGDENYTRKMYKSYLWFLGLNSLRAPLYDKETGGCCDGLHPNGVNRNQGAESTLAYLISHLSVMLSFKQNYQASNDVSKLEKVMIK